MKVKSYTDIEQSKKLAEILPLESADLSYNNASIRGVNYVDEFRMEPIPYVKAENLLSSLKINPLFNILPCWSLVALLNAIPQIKIRGSKKIGYIVYYKNIASNRSFNIIDAAYEMIIKLKEKNLIWNQQKKNCKK